MPTAQRSSVRWSHTREISADLHRSHLTTPTENHSITLPGVPLCHSRAAELSRAPIRTALGVLSFAERRPLAQRHRRTVTEPGANGLDWAYLRPFWGLMMFGGLTGRGYKYPTNGIDLVGIRYWM